MINIKTDYQKIKPGDIYVALRGVNTDGHDYINQAIQKGARKIIAETGNYSITTELVDNTYDYLAKYLRKNYNEFLHEMNIIGVTGTNGKSSVSYLLYDAMTRLGYKVAFLGTMGYFLENQKEDGMKELNICDIYDYMIQAYDKGFKYFILEVSCHDLEQEKVKTIPFDDAIFTNLSESHLDAFVTMEKYAEVKQQLFRHLKSGGIAIINGDDNYASNFILANNYNLVYGTKEGVHFKIGEYELNPNGMIFKFSYKGDTYQVNTSLIGKYNIYNLMAVIVYLLALGVKPVPLLKTIYALKAPSGYMDMIKYNSSLIIIDYAHTPDAMEKVLMSIKEFTTGDIYVIFGCAGGKDRNKRPMMAYVASKLSKQFIITNDDPGYEDENQIVNDILSKKDFTNYEVILDRKEAINKGISYLRGNDALVILGKGYEQYMKIREQEIPFNDKNAVLEYLEKVRRRR